MPFKRKKKIRGKIMGIVEEKIFKNKIYALLKIVFL
jgi:hypothetical protein